MGILNLLKKRNTQLKQTKYLSLMNGLTPVFNEFGNDIYASDIVQNCIRCICTEMSKLQPRHIRTDSETGEQIEVNSDINRLFKYGPNPFMTTSDFLETVTYIREVNKNVFIYPTFTEVDYGNNKVGRRYTGFYPLNPTQVQFIQDLSGKVFIKFTFANFEEYTLPYQDVIHWRKDFGANELMGGDINGTANNDALLKLLKTDNIVTQNLEKAVKASLSVKGLLKINTYKNTEAQLDELKIFEGKIKKAESGILPIDLKQEFTPITLDPKLIDKDTMQFIVTRILNNYRVPLAIFNGNFTEEDYQAFYEGKLEADVLSLGRAINKTLFTQRQLELNNEVICYSQGLLFTNMANKIAAVKILSDNGLLTGNQILAVFNYPPFEGGNTRPKSLNYINSDIADQYQLSKVKGGGTDE